jgi:multimeric flavodoxin WrbA
MEQKIKTFFKYISEKDKQGFRILFITTSNRWSGSGETPKSSQIALEIKNKLINCEVIDISKLKIHPCEGNVSREVGNRCGLKEALLKDNKKNPHKFIRCWASINNSDDELYVIANKIYESDIIIFFGSVRWGKMNSIYSNLIERLTWIENIHSTLREKNPVKDKEAGVVVMGHNWKGLEVLENEVTVLKYFGFKTPKELSFNRQWTTDPTDETNSGYKQDLKEFLKEKKNIFESIKESFKDFTDFLKFNR